MFPLHTKTFPVSATALESLLNESLRRVLITGSDPVRVVDRDYPSLEAIIVTLDGAEVRRNPPPPKMTVGSTSDAIQLQRLQIRGRALSVGPAAASLTLDASDVRLKQGRDAANEVVLELESAADGTVEISTGKADLERAIAEVAGREASKQGVEVQDVRLTLRQLGPRAVESEASFSARKMFFTAKVRITAQLAIDDELNASVSNLRCIGEGAIGSLACGFLAPHLQKLDGRTFPLMTLSLGEIRLRDIRLSAGDKLSVAAEFGS